MEIIVPLPCCSCCHPPRGLLRDVGLGTVPLSLAQVIYEHLSECEECADTMRRVVKEYVEAREASLVFSFMLSRSVCTREILVCIYN